VIPPAFIHDLLARTDVVEIVGRHVQLKKAGINHKGLCPFHGEKTPSFIVSPSRQTYHCFGCGVHGNAIGFLMEHAGLGFIDAVRDLAQQAGMKVPEDDRSPQDREHAAALKQHQATLTDVLAKAAEHYRQQLKATPRAVDYLKKRGLTGAIAARFGVGYAPENWRGLASVFPSYDDPLLEEGGLVISHPADESTNTEAKRYDRFRDRIMFPIRSVQGEVIGFGGRVLDKGEPKYLNSPETPVFVKGRELYGLYEARTALRQRGHVLVVEGYMDVVALAQLGFPNAVATLGTACTTEHVHKLFRFTDSVVFSFDGDAAGRRAAARALEAALPHANDTRSIRFLFLPPEHDPDSFVREHGAEAFEACIAKAVPLSRQLLDAAGAECDLEVAEGRARMLANAKPLWAALPEGALKRQIAADIAALARLPTHDMLAGWGLGAAAAPGGGRRPFKPGMALAPRRVARSAANLLDRALWLLVQRSDLWAALDGVSHDLLAGQAPPYDAFFNTLERSALEHGALAPQALLGELRATAERDGGEAVLQRVAGFVAPEAQTDLGTELRIVLDRLRLEAVGEELQLLLESGDLTEEDQRRFAALNAERSRLKARVGGAAPSAA